jgi:hypothetical protein
MVPVKLQIPEADIIRRLDCINTPGEYTLVAERVTSFIFHSMCLATLDENARTMVVRKELLWDVSKPHWSISKIKEEGAKIAAFLMDNNTIKLNSKNASILGPEYDQPLMAIYEIIDVDKDANLRIKFTQSIIHLLHLIRTNAFSSDHLLHGNVHVISKARRPTAIKFYWEVCRAQRTTNTLRLTLPEFLEVIQCSTINISFSRITHKYIEPIRENLKGTTAEFTYQSLGKNKRGELILEFNFKSNKEIHDEQMQSSARYNFETNLKAVGITDKEILELRRFVKDKILTEPFVNFSIEKAYKALLSKDTDRLGLNKPAGFILNAIKKNYYSEEFSAHKIVNYDCPQVIELNLLTIGCGKTKAKQNSLGDSKVGKSTDNAKKFKALFKSLYGIKDENMLTFLLSFPLDRLLDELEAVDDDRHKIKIIDSFAASEYTKAYPDQIGAFRNEHMSGVGPIEFFNNLDLIMAYMKLTLEHGFNLNSDLIAVIKSYYRSNG